MGSDLSCPCNRPVLEPEEAPNKIDIMKEVMQGKLNPNDIIYEFEYDQTKAYLIRTEHVEAFYNNRNLLKLSKEKEINRYFNTIFISNFMAKQDIVLIVMQHSHEATPSSNSNNTNNYDYNTNNSNSNTNSMQQHMNSNTFRKKANDLSGKFMIESINLISSEKNQVIKQILHDLNNKLKKGYYFLGITNDTQKYNRHFKILYKMGYTHQDQREYFIFTYEGQLNQRIIEDILNKMEHKSIILRAIMIDNPNEYNYSTKGKLNFI